MEDFFKLVGAIVVIVAVAFGTWMIETFWLMIALGDARLDWLHNLPPVGFTGLLGISFALAAFFGSVVSVTVRQIVKSN